MSARHERHERHECNISTTLATRVQHESDTSNTSATQVQHGCYTQTIRVQHKCYTNDTSGAQVQNCDFDNDTSKNIFSHPYIYYMASERLQGEEQFHFKN